MPRGNLFTLLQINLFWFLVVASFHLIHLCWKRIRRHSHFSHFYHYNLTQNQWCSIECVVQSGPDRLCKQRQTTTPVGHTDIPVVDLKVGSLVVCCSVSEQIAVSESNKLTLFFILKVALASCSNQKE